VPARALDTIEHLAGMQAQAPLAPYVGLWTRLQDFDPRELSDLTQNRRVVRLHLMRNTVHLVSARDALDWRALFSPLLAREYEGHFRGGTDGTKLDRLLDEARRLLEERPRTRAELGRLLAERWPGADSSALAYAVSHHLALCQVPPRGLWGRGGPAAWAPVEQWLGAPLATASPGDLVLRYLGAFGPATVADIQLWSGLTRLRELVEQLPLQRFHSETGETLYDLPDAPRPAEDMPATPRFLPAYDNLLLSYLDRARVIPDGRPVPLPAGNGATIGTFLVDGQWQGTWQVRNHTMRVEPFGRLPKADRDAIIEEATGLCAFLDADASYEVVLAQR
jgi:hypothetical protein